MVGAHVRLARNDFGLVLQKNCGFRFGFGFTKLTVASVFRFSWAYIRLSMSTPSFIYACTV